MKKETIIFLKDLQDTEWNKIIDNISQNCKLYIDENSFQIFNDIPPNNIDLQKQLYICEFIVGDTPKVIKNKI